MEIVYETKGRAQEYAKLGLNLYTTCEHGCAYCYNPAATFKDSEQFFKPGIPKKRIFERLRKDCETLSRLKECPEILISFVGDPYQPEELKFGITHLAILMLTAYDLPFTILTKGGTRAVRDFCLLEGYDKARFGTTVVFLEQSFADIWEPNAPSINDRIEAIKQAHELGIKTWVSLEPVIDPGQAFQVIAFLHRWVDFWCVGKLNHVLEIEKKIDWIEFREKVKELLDAIGANYYLKRSLTEL